MTNGGCEYRDGGGKNRHADRAGLARAARRLWLPVIAVLALFGAGSDCLGSETRGARVQRAVDQYMEALECRERTRRLSLFSRAEQLFRQVIEGDAEHPPVRNADLYVNMGNAALQAERIGPAIVAYRRALHMAPQHAQARQNLSYARSLLPEWVSYDDTPSLLGSLFFWRSLLTASQIHLWAAICFLLAAALVAVSIVRRQNLWRNLAILPLLAWIVLLGSLHLEPNEAASRDAVVVEESRVFAADSTSSPPRLSKPLPSGAELRMIQKRGRWSELQLPDGRTGWVLSTAVDILPDARAKSGNMRGARPRCKPPGPAPAGKNAF